ncbi:creatininase family protein [Actinomadura madurae]|uniref:creatininase family protein n=1 Tax=Actinomadura madurae TaxID=1993 RepID=UPI002026537F|nr:creatininase family protein [Actinomadura madurae]MCP9951446.1 creatininase family protein [Actinomadura madurae]MCP9968222.1 creatininase family protein [Actinomadura madurae]MCP9980680.1 creatininase family protein [Actinomadura madurae]MCQ0007811.1 creatininase family protein [Actinomadura madurae]MCQ0016879.1 creatininase family protein [Actinomadura madurae]
MTYSIFAHTMADMTYPELERAAETGTPVLLPIGVIEEHGPHLPLGTDIYGAYQLAVLVRERLAADGADALIAPPLYWGINQVTSAFTGSFTISPKTARALLDDVLDSLLDQGFDRILLINHHGDRLHNQMLLDAVRRQHDRGSREVRWLESDRIIDRLGGDREDPVWLYYAMPSETETLKSATTLGVHANDQETALVARWFPELVDYEALWELRPTDLTVEDLARWRKGGEHAKAVTPLGYFGDPQPRDPMLWRVYTWMADAMAQAVHDASRT